jgi:hypothetical protein
MQFKKNLQNNPRNEVKGNFVYILHTTSNSVLQNILQMKWKATLWHILHTKWNMSL